MMIQDFLKNPKKLLKNPYRYGPGQGGKLDYEGPLICIKTKVPVLTFITYNFIFTNKYF